MPAVAWTGPIRMSYVIWVAANARTADGAKRMRRRPVLPRSLRRAGAGSACHTVETSRFEASAIDVLGYVTDDIDNRRGFRRADEQSRRRRPSARQGHVLCYPAAQPHSARYLAIPAGAANAPTRWAGKTLSEAQKLAAWTGQPARAVTQPKRHYETRWEDAA